MAEVVHGIDIKDRSHECPDCGWRLAKGGFCMHVHPITGDSAAVFDGVLPREDSQRRLEPPPDAVSAPQRDAETRSGTKEAQAP